MSAKKANDCEVCCKEDQKKQEERKKLIESAKSFIDKRNKLFKMARDLEYDISTDFGQLNLEDVNFISNTKKENKTELNEATKGIDRTMKALVKTLIKAEILKAEIIKLKNTYEKN